MAKTLVLFGYHDQNSPRFLGIKKAMIERGYDVLECHTDAKGFFRKCKDLFRQWRSLPVKPDALLVTFPGQYLMPLAWKLTRFPRRELILDAFVSLHDSVVTDRKLISPWNPYAWVLWLLDWLSVHLADEVILDTVAHKEFFEHAFGLSPKHVSVVYLSAREDLFKPSPKTAHNGTLRIFFYGTFIPLQGVEYILEAFSILEQHGVKFAATLVGGGQQQKMMETKSHDLHLKSVTFIPFVPLDELPALMAKNDLCLGIFGTSDKAARVIPHKVYDAVAMQIPVITRDSPAIRERFENDPLVKLVPAGIPEALAKAIEEGIRNRT